MTVFDVCGDSPTNKDLDKIEIEQERSMLLQIAGDSEDESVIELRDQLVMVTKLVHDEELEERKKLTSRIVSVSGGLIYDVTGQSMFGSWGVPSTNVVFPPVVSTPNSATYITSVSGTLTVSHQPYKPKAQPDQQEKKGWFNKLFDTKDKE